MVPNKIQFSTNSINGSLSKGGAKISYGTNSGPTHITGFYNGITPPENGYTFYIKKDGFVEDGLILFLDAGNYSSYRNDLNSTEWWDLSGNGNNGTINGATFDSGNEGSFVFDGVNDYIKIDNVLIVSPDELTIGGWIMKKNIGNGSYECALHHGSDNSIGGSSYWFGFQTGTNNLCATIGASAGVGWTAGLTSTVAEFDTWYHICASWDGSIVRVYINGTYNKQYNLSSYINRTTPTRIGSSSDGSNYQVGGKIGEIWIYERGLSESEVQQNFNCSKGRFGL